MTMSYGGKSIIGLKPAPAGAPVGSYGAGGNRAQAGAAGVVIIEEFY